MKNILFICTGNTCRSPMAEALLREKSDDKVMVKSAGISAADGQPAHPYTQKVLENKGINLDHQSRALTGDLVGWADLILTMTENHKRMLLQEYPGALSKAFTLREYVDQEDEEHWKAYHEAVAETEMKRAAFQSKLKDQSLSEVGIEKLHDEMEEVLMSDMMKIQELERKLPDRDIADPFGGDEEVYRYTCEEIEQLLDKLIAKYV